MKKKSTSKLYLNKTSITILDDKSLMEIKGGFLPNDPDKGSCRYFTCHTKAITR